MRAAVLLWPAAVWMVRGGGGVFACTIWSSTGMRFAARVQYLSSHNATHIAVALLLCLARGMPGQWGMSVQVA
jgi:hypothetical protein